MTYQLWSTERETQKLNMANCEGVSDYEVNILSCRITTTYPYRFEPLAKYSLDIEDSSESDSEGESTSITPDPSPDRGPGKVAKW